MGNSKRTQNSSMGNGKGEPKIEKEKLKKRTHFRRKKIEI